MQNMFSIMACVLRFLKRRWKAVVTSTLVTGVFTSVVGSFVYDSLKTLGTPATSTAATVDPVRPSADLDVDRFAQLMPGEGKPTVSDEQRRAEAAAKRRVMLAELLGTDAYRPGTTLIAVRAGQEASPTSQAAARAAASVLVRHFDREGRLAVEVQPVFAKSPYFNELMNGSLQPIKSAGLDKKLRTAIFATVDASCASATSVAGVVVCTVDIRMRAVDADLQFVLSANWPGKGAGTNERDALTRAVEQVFEDHATQLKRL
jgi:hypothetical protein